MPKNDLAHDVDQLRALSERFGQGHVFRFWKELDSEERSSLLRQLHGIDFQLMDRLARELSAPPRKSEEAVLSPAPIVRVPQTREEKEKEAEARAKGEDLLREGRVAALVVAGGQGTRLGFDGPKGAFEIGPLTRRTLFQHHAEKILATSRRYGAAIPWFLMTSEANHQATAGFFREKGLFGLPRGDVRFFQQGMIPAVDREGRFLLESRSRIFTSPNGHGGSLKALHESGSLAEMKKRGIGWIFYFQVDNPLLTLCDPVFLGYHALHGAEMSSRVVRKAGWKEKVGVIGLRDGRLTVIEYSDLPEAKARETLPDGSLKYWAGSVAIHVLSVDFVERLNQGGFRLPYHRAEKSVPFLDEAGVLQRPKEKNGIKFETFVFDALSEAERTVTLEALRADEFSPVKNSAGEDSPETSRQDMTAQFLRWLESSGAVIERERTGAFSGYVELSPLTALDAKDLAGRIPSGTVVRPGFIL
jgi:UDP-N-acetylglucosamine/UDP-N-acetylgalactosamine diphosphorylase